LERDVLREVRVGVQALEIQPDLVPVDLPAQTPRAAHRPLAVGWQED
jgi:hypothetical protein